MPYPREKKTYPNIAEELAESLERTGWLVHNKLETFLKQYQLTPQQFNVLSILRAARGSLPTLEIAKRMFQKLPDITRLIDRVEKAKYVRRERLDTDRRVVMVHLTEEGRAFVEAIDQPLSQFCAANLQHMTEHEVQLLLLLLRKVRQDNL